MSRIGRMPIAIPAGVTVTVDDTNLVTVKGPKGENSYRANTAMQVKVEDGSVTVTVDAAAAEPTADTVAITFLGNIK